MRESVIPFFAKEFFGKTVCENLFTVAAVTRILRDGGIREPDETRMNIDRNSTREFVHALSSGEQAVHIILFTDSAILIT